MFELYVYVGFILWLMSAYFEIKANDFGFELFSWKQTLFSLTLFLTIWPFVIAFKLGERS